MVRRGLVWHGMAGMVGFGLVWHGEVRFGLAG